MWRTESPGWILVYEEAFVQGLALTLPDGARMVNIGAGPGTSASALLRGTAHLRDAHVTSIDLDDTAWEKEMETLQHQGLFDLRRIKQVVGDSAAVGRDWKKEGGPDLDLIFVDGSHSYEGVTADLAAWTPHLTPGGLLICHDYADVKQERVTQAINEWYHAHSDWTVIGKVLYTLALRKPGGDETWRNGRL